MDTEALLQRRPLRPLRSLIELIREWLERFVAVQGVDRAMALGAQAYTALIPLLIVYVSILPRRKNSSFAEVLVDRFDLSGATAESVRSAFAPAGTVQSGVTALSIVLLLVSALSFTRGLQRLYEGSYGLPKLGMRNTPRGLLWLGIIVVVLVLRPTILSPLSGVALTIGTLAISTGLWLVTPYLLLGRRLSWQRLLPGALLTAIGMAGAGVYTVIWMPHLLASSASQFGMIGIGFALVTWLVAIAGVIVVTTTGGAMMADRMIGPRPAP